MSLQRLSHPSFCIISPTAYLHGIADRSNTHLCLAHLVDKDPLYTDFYLSMSERGDYVIMDNSAFELSVPYSPERLIELGKRCGANAIVLPDYPGQPASKTINAAKQFIPLFKDAGFDCFYAPQSRKGELSEWVDAYSWGALNPYVDIIGMSILGIPNAIPHVPAAYARVVMSHILIERKVFNFDTWHHFLGLNSGPNLEIPALIKMDALTTCDSSGPVWSAILGHEYTANTDSYLSTIKPKMHVNFDHPVVHDDATLKRIHHNIDMTLDLFR